MLEPIEQPTNAPAQVDAAIELATLRRVNEELKQKSSTRKAKIAELEASIAELQGKLTETQGSLHQVTVNGPLKAMAESLSKTPELWLEQFEKMYRLEMVKGQLTIHSATDGKPVSIPFEREALIKHLIDDAHPLSNRFKAITIVSRASGAGGGGSRTVAPEPATPKPQFGFV